MDEDKDFEGTEEEQRFIQIYDATVADAEVSPIPANLKERLEVFGEAYADVEGLDHSETIMAITSAWPIFRAWMEEQRG